MKNVEADTEMRKNIAGDDVGSEADNEDET